MANKITKSQRQDATIEVLNHVTEVLFYFFQETEEDLEIEQVLNDFTSSMWDIAVVSMAAAGMKITGINEDGTYSATFSPVKSIKEFMINDDYASDDDTFFEDIAERLPGGDMGKHENRLLGD